MAAISGVSADRYDLSFENPSPKEIPTVRDQLQARLGDSEKRMKFEELLHRASSPNLSNLDRELVLKIQLDGRLNLKQQFPLLIELFKIKVQALKNAGISPEEFAAQIKSWAESNVLPELDKEPELKENGGMALSLLLLLLQTVDNIDLPRFSGFDGDQTELKKELCVLAMGLFTTADSLSKPFFSTSNTSLQLFDLEKETGFALFESNLLCKELRRILNLDTGWFLKNITPLQKTLSHLENEGRFERITQIVNQRLSTLASREDSLQVLPYIIKYTSPEKLETYFKDRFEKFSKLSHNWWKNSLRSVELHCEAAEMIAPLDKQKAQDYLAQAEKEMKDKLRAHFFSLNRTSIEQRRLQAEKRIAEAKKNI